jgi:chromosome segregation ATPase
MKTQQIRTNNTDWNRNLLKKNKELKGRLVRNESELSRAKKQITELKAREAQLRKTVHDLKVTTQLLNSKLSANQKAIRKFETLYSELERELGQ